MFKEVVEMGVKEANMRVLRGMSPDELKKMQDLRIHALHNRMNMLETWGTTMSPRELALHQRSIARLSEEIGHIQTGLQAQGQEAWLRANATPGRAPPKPTPSIKFLGKTFKKGVPGPDPVHGAADARAALTRASPYLEAQGGGMLGRASNAVRGAWNGLGPMGKLGLGAGAVVGGGMLLKNLMGSDDQQPRQLPMGY